MTLEEIREICRILKPIYLYLKKEMNQSEQKLHEFFGVRLLIASKEETFEQFLNKLLSLCGYVKLEITKELNYKIIKECPFLISAMIGGEKDGRKIK